MCIKKFKELLLKIKPIDDFYSQNERVIISKLQESIDFERKLRKEIEKKEQDCQKELVNFHDEATSAYNLCMDENRELRGQIFKPSIAEEYWENKYPQTNLAYPRYETDGQYSVDLRNWFQLYDKNIPTVSDNNFDSICLNSLKWVYDKIKYTSDLKVYGKNEYWAYPYQVLKHKEDDCDGGAILLANIILKTIYKKFGSLGLYKNYWRVKLNAGSVKGGGHLYVTVCYIAEEEKNLHPNEWKLSGYKVLDWCYWYNSLDLFQRSFHRDERNYYGIWFSWDLLHCFAKPTYLTQAKKILPVTKYGRR